MILLVGIFYFFLRLEPLSRFLLFGTAIMHSFFEVIVFGLIYMVQTVDVPGHEQKTRHDNQTTHEDYLDVSPRNVDSSEGVSLKEVIQNSITASDEFIDELCSADSIDNRFAIEDVHVLSTRTPFNIEILPKDTYQLFFNIEKLNNFRLINDYFLDVHHKLRAGGWIIAKYLAIEDDWYRLRSKMPEMLFYMLYPVYFLIHRISPKIPYLKSLYFFFTQGYNQKISRAEVLGRLSFCGFKVAKEVKQGSDSYIVAQKLKMPSDISNPSYGPIIRLNRIGYQGKQIKIYKFRTMHPYSEFIQKEVFESNALNSKGKLRDDFRVTQWGKIIRMMWIDEFPQLLNWLRGDIALVGVRALSEHYFSLYPEDLQDLRIQFKPGLVPPYYADMPNSFEEIINSERQYLNQKKMKLFTTDLKYLSKAMYNILIKGARSS